MAGKVRPVGANSLVGLCDLSVFLLIVSCVDVHRHRPGVKPSVLLAVGGLVFVAAAAFDIDVQVPLCPKLPSDVDEVFVREFDGLRAAARNGAGRAYAG